MRNVAHYYYNRKKLLHSILTSIFPETKALAALFQTFETRTIAKQFSRLDSDTEKARETVLHPK